MIAAAESGRQWVYTGSVNINEDSRVTSGVRPPQPQDAARLIFRYNAIPGGGSNVAVRRDLLLEVGLFDPRHKNTEDWDLWIRLAEVEMPAWVPGPLVAKRVHSSKASLDIGAIFEGVSLIEQRRGMKIDRGVLHRWIAESCLRTGQRTRPASTWRLPLRMGRRLASSGDLLVILGRRLDRYLGRRPIERTRHRRGMGRSSSTVATRSRQRLTG